MNWFVLLLLTIIAYLLGSFPSGVVLGKTFKGVDVRDFGSGKTGATNSLRTLGWQISLLVFILDNAKGAVSVWLPLLLLSANWRPWGVLACGLATMLGHDYSIFIGFKGGRGVANGIGQVLVVSPFSMLFAAIVSLPLLALTRYVSLASVVGSFMVEIALIVNYFLGTLPNNDARFLLWGTVITGLIVVQHRDNIQRLLNGTERKLGEKAKPVADKAAPRQLFRDEKIAPTQITLQEPADKADKSTKTKIG